MEALLATPVTAVELLASKVAPYFVLGMTSATLCLALAVWLFGVPFRGSVGAFYLLCGKLSCPFARAGHADFRGDQEPVSRFAGGVDQRVPAVVPALRLLVRDRFACRRRSSGSR